MEDNGEYLLITWCTNFQQTNIKLGYYYELNLLKHGFITYKA